MPAEAGESGAVAHDLSAAAVNTGAAALELSSGTLELTAEAVDVDAEALKLLSSETLGTGAVALELTAVGVGAVALELSEESVLELSAPKKVSIDSGLLVLVALARGGAYGDEDSIE